MVWQWLRPGSVDYNCHDNNKLSVMVKMMWCMDGNSDDIYNIIVDNFSSWSILSLSGILFTNLVGDIL